MDSLIAAPGRSKQADQAEHNRLATGDARDAGRKEAVLKITHIELVTLLPFMGEGWQRETIRRVAETIERELSPSRKADGNSPNPADITARQS